MLDTIFDTPEDRKFFTDDIIEGRLTVIRYSPHGSPGSFEYYHLPVVPELKPLDQKILDQKPLDQKLLDQKPLGQKPLGQKPLDPISEEDE